MAEEDPWAFDDGNKAPTPSAGTPKRALKTGSTADSTVGSKAGSQEPGTPSGAVAGEEEAPPPPPPEDDGYRKPVRLYRHWVRPKFLQYKYMYNYRTNYYDDVIDYLDKKQRGISREIPQPQTWAERVLRTNAARRESWLLDVYPHVAISPKNLSPDFEYRHYMFGRILEPYQYQQKDDSHLIITLPASIKTHNYHTKAYINQKYSNVL